MNCKGTYFGGITYKRVKLFTKVSFYTIASFSEVMNYLVNPTIEDYQNTQYPVLDYAIKYLASVH
jgi:hypothetical protein